MSKYVQGFQGIKQDISESSANSQFYFEARNMVVFPENKPMLGGMGNIKSNKLQCTIPTILDNTETITINGGIEIDDNTLILITTHAYNSTIVNGIFKYPNPSNPTSTNAVSIYKPGGNEADLGIREKVTILHNKENENVDKIYWIDGDNQIRSLNMALTAPITSIPVDHLNIIGDFTYASLSIIEGVSYGGTHTSGKIQYAYSYYNQNGSSTKISPLSNIISLTKADGQGGDLNQVVGQVNKLNFTNLPTDYDYIRIYAIKYNTLTEEPVINIIQEYRLGDSTSLEVLDDGSVIFDISTEEFLFLGGDVFVPKAIEIKDNRLFAGNIEERDFDITPEQLDCRAYRRNSSNEVSVDGFIYNDLTNIDLDADCIQTDFDTYKYTSDNSILGAEGINLTLSFNSSTIDKDNNDLKVYKGNEIYRFGIIFYNDKGQASRPQWICDYKIPQSNINGTTYTPAVQLTPTAVSALQSLGAVKYTLARVERTEDDKTIIAQGFLSTMMFKVNKNANHFNDIDDTDLSTETGYTSNSIGYYNRELESLENVAYPLLYKKGFNIASNRYSRLKHNNSLNPKDDYTNRSEIIGLLNSDDDVYGNKKLDEYAVSNGQYWEIEYNEGTANTYDEGIFTRSYQDTKIWQLNSPDIIFRDVKIPSQAKIRITGFNKHNGIPNSSNYRDHRNINGDYFLELIDKSDSVILGVSLYDDTTSENIETLVTYAVAPPTQFVGFSTNNEWDIYGTPLLMERGQSKTYYNNNKDFTICNNLIDFHVDVWERDAAKILGANTKTSKNITLIPIKDTNSPHNKKYNHKRLEEALLELDNSIIGEEGDIIAELVRVNISSIYGGNTYENRSRNTYLTLGNLREVQSIKYEFTNSGDTYFGICNIARNTFNNSLSGNEYIRSISDFYQCYLETQVDNKRRNDISVGMASGDIVGLKTTLYDNFHKYNTVYSREPNVAPQASKSYLEQTMTKFPNIIRASKVKVSGETIDSFTDFLVNEESQLNSKYGDITKLRLFNDNLYVFQENAVVLQSINPAYQVASDESVQVELGTGKLFGKDVYLTTESGVLYKDRFSVVNSSSAVYFLDRNNISINRIKGGIEGLTDSKGVHSLLYNNLFKAGDESYFGFDFIKNNLYCSIPTTEGIDTLMFNELYDNFISWIDLTPSYYIPSRDGIMSVLNKGVWIENLGNDFGKLYDSPRNLNLTLLVKPSEYSSCRFDSVEWKSILRTIEGNRETFNQIRVYNEEQDTLEVSFIPRNKFDMFRVNVPRHNQGITANRINGRWVYISLDMLSNIANEGKQFILHNLGVNYMNKL